MYEKRRNNYEVFVYGLYIINYGEGDRSFLDLRNEDGIFNYLYNIVKIGFFFKDF